MEESKKYDHGKLRWDLLPLNLIEKVVEIYTFGAEKYGANTWQNLEDGYNRYKAAMFRHLMEFEKGNVVDDDSGKEHLAHCCWNILAMLHFSEKDQKYKDDIEEWMSEVSGTIYVEDVEPKVEYVIYPNIGQNVEFSYNYEGGVFNSVGTIEKYVLDKNGETFYVREESERGGGFTYMLKREEIIKPI